VGVTSNASEPPTRRSRLTLDEHGEGRTATGTVDHRDPLAGVALACDLALAVREHGGLDGVHLIPGVRYREVAARLERELT
jgi:hypothetical protein